MRNIYVNACHQPSSISLPPSVFSLSKTGTDPSTLVPRSGCRVSGIVRKQGQTRLRSCLASGVGCRVSGVGYRPKTGTDPSALVPRSAWVSPCFLALFLHPGTRYPIRETRPSILRPSVFSLYPSRSGNRMPIVPQACSLHIPFVILDVSGVQARCLRYNPHRFFQRRLALHACPNETF